MSKLVIDWSRYDHLFGTMIDNKIGEIIESENPTITISNSYLSSRRRSLNIKAYRKRSKKSPINVNERTEFDYLIGTMSDQAIADKFKCIRNVVRRRRIVLKIEPYRPHKKHHIVNFRKEETAIKNQQYGGIDDMNIKGLTPDLVVEILGNLILDDSDFSNIAYDPFMLKMKELDVEVYNRITNDPSKINSLKKSIETTKGKLANVPGYKNTLISISKALKDVKIQNDSKEISIPRLTELIENEDENAFSFDIVKFISPTAEIIPVESCEEIDDLPKGKLLIVDECPFCKDSKSYFNSPIDTDTIYFGCCNPKCDGYHWLDIRDMIRIINDLRNNFQKTGDDCMDKMYEMYDMSDANKKEKEQWTSFIQFISSTDLGYEFSILQLSSYITSKRRSGKKLSLPDSIKFSNGTLTEKLMKGFLEHEYEIFKNEHNKEYVKLCKVVDDPYKWYLKKVTIGKITEPKGADSDLEKSTNSLTTQHNGTMYEIVNDKQMGKIVENLWHINHTREFSLADFDYKKLFKEFCFKSFREFCDYFIKHFRNRIFHTSTGYILIMQYYTNEKTFWIMEKILSDVEIVKFDKILFSKVVSTTETIEAPVIPAPEEEIAVEKIIIDVAPEAAKSIDLSDAVDEPEISEEPVIVKEPEDRVKSLSEELAELKNLMVKPSEPAFVVDESTNDKTFVNMLKNYLGVSRLEKKIDDMEEIILTLLEDRDIDRKKIKDLEEHKIISILNSAKVNSVSVVNTDGNNQMPVTHTADPAALEELRKIKEAIISKWSKFFEIYYSIRKTKPFTIHELSIAIESNSELKQSIPEYHDNDKIHHLSTGISRFIRSNLEETIPTKHGNIRISYNKSKSIYTMSLTNESNIISFDTSKKYLTTNEVMPILTKYRHLYGKQSDVSIAKMIGCRSNIISIDRNRLGIPKYLDARTIQKVSFNK